ncbi:MAG: hypothetical protein M1835_006137 [Candelina submexicana]|nr:MAG: hypothetical protein M1835_006137 [Candelina submexicana]
MATSEVIIVGGGPAGCALAYRLASCRKAPSVTLIEAGGDNADVSLRVTADRYETFTTQPALNWGYKTVPQEHAKGKQLDYSRGRGLGGSSAINFSVFTHGPRDDYDEWARLVDDDIWSWENVKRRFKRIEAYESVKDKKIRRYIQPEPGAHGHDGPVKVGFPDIFEKGIVEVIDAAEEAGLPINKDLNSGNPIGMGVPPSTSSMGQRVTAASSYLVDAPKNLTIVTHTPAIRILFDGKKAVGVESSGKRFFASKEVILSAGAIDSPKILLLSGVGPEQELRTHGIAVLEDLPGVGKNLHDHNVVPLVVVQKPGTNDRPSLFDNAEALAAAREQWLKDYTGPLASFYSAMAMGFFKSDAVLRSGEFQALPKSTQDFLRRETVPHFEIGSGLPRLGLEDDDTQKGETTTTYEAFWMNPQSVGELKLQSSNPKDLLLMDPRALSHPFDRRVAIETMRTCMDLLETPLLAKNTLRCASAPKSKREDDIYDYIQKNIFSSWHMCSTIKMGKPDEAGTCVDKDFRVVGLENLRVVDMSIVPLIPNAHTQSTAYLIGETAAEKLINEYSLE